MTLLPDRDDRDRALNDFQRNLVVTAGAGTGKTALLVGRLANALVRQHFETHQILALTFTDNAAAEMRERLVRLLRAVEPWLDGEPVEHASDLHTLEDLGFGPEDRSRVREVLAAADQLPITTFHGFCAGLLRRNARRLGLPPEQTIGDEDASYTQFREVFLDYLREQPADPVHEALLRFEPKELRALGWELTKLPTDSIANGLPRPPTDRLDAILEELTRLRAVSADVAPRSRKIPAQIDCAIAIATALRDGTEVDDSTELGTKAATSKHFAEHDRLSLQSCIDTLLPHVSADDEAVACAVDFVTPLVDRFRKLRTEAGRFTFDDIILETREHLMRDAELRRDAGAGLGAILVDEFQDTDPLQYDIVFLLAAQPTTEPIGTPLDSELRPNVLFIVGDPKQSIYRFRGADLAAFDQASQRVLGQGGAACKLVANFRCAPAVLDLVNHVGAAMLTDDRPYQLGYEPVYPQTDPEHATVEILTPSEGEEARAAERRAFEGELVVQTIERLRSDGAAYRDCAVLLRAATDTSWLLRVLREVGIPYALQGSRRFYTRHEIVVATALLTAIARPHDPVGVLGVLRSALSSATDREIHEFLSPNDATLDYRKPRRTHAGAVEQTLRWLHSLHEQAIKMPVDAALELLLDLDEWKVAEGSGYEGAQRLANLDKFLTTLRRIRPTHLEDAVEFAERRTIQETDDEESPLFDRELDAIAIMTIHAAKGLEFDTVIIPDLARSSHASGGMPSEAEVSRVFDADGGALTGIRIGASRNAASFWIRTEQQRHEAAEERRLFYVAATRAKRRLILIQTGGKAPHQSWQSDLGRCAPMPASTRIRTVDVVRPDPIDQATQAHGITATLAAWREHERTAHVPTIDEEPTITPLTPSLFEARPRDVETDATTFGSLVHRYLALVDLDHGFDSELCEAIADAESIDELRDLASQFHRSSLCERIRTADRIRRELPVAHQSHGSLAHGVLDLLLEEAGRFTIIDHKTDRVVGNRHRDAAERHKDQLERYAESVRRALGLATTPSRAVYFVRDDVLVDI